MPLDPGSKLGPYEIASLLGAGGMGEVYRAHDTRLGRDVALKALPAAFAQDPERLARFEREAKLLASLNHPNIAAIYGLEEAHGHRYLVLELIDGETLGQRLARGALPLDEALEICRQVAAALEVAHESGIVHRDLKPGNVMLTATGGVKVLDFGLAKGGGAGSPGSDPALSASPTLTYAATSAGVILGTAAYMSPEQARGKAVDKRTDIWSFGCLLYECLSGRQAFEGETVSDLIARILEREPDLAALPPQTPGRVRDLVRHCLEKDPRRRMRDIGDARIELEDAIALRSSASTRTMAVLPAGPRARWRLLAIGAAIAVASATLTAFLAGLLHRAPAAAAVRFSVAAPKDMKFIWDSHFSAISPDGRTLAVIMRDSTGAVKIGLRSLESLEFRQLVGTDHAQALCWSPDSRAIAFFADGKLKKIATGDGTVEALCDANNGRGATWNKSGVILFCPAGGGPLFRVPANGGDPQQVTKLDSTRQETGHRFPCFLPDGRHFLFTVLSGRQGKFDIDIGSLDSPGRKTLFTAESGVVYTEPGYLIYRRNDALVAQRFDAGGQRLIGQPLPLGDIPVVSEYTGSPPATVSANGVLSYVPLGTLNVRLEWIDPMGKELGPVGIPPDQYISVDMSPDGRRAALVRPSSGTEADIWIADLERRAVTRFTYGPANNEEPRWSPDGTRIAFRSNRNGRYDFFIKPANGSAPEELLHHSNVMFKDIDSWSDDGQYVVSSQLDPTTGWDLWVIPMNGDHTARPYLRTRFTERNGAISPDGRWMGYQSDESGPLEYYVQSFPTPGNKVQITNGGGGPGGWSPDGKQLYFGGKDGVMVADVLPGAEFQIGTPRLFAKDPEGVIGYVTGDRALKKFLALLPVGSATTGSITVILNWTQALKKS